MTRVDELRKSAGEYLSRSLGGKFSPGQPQGALSLTHYEMVELLAKFADERLRDHERGRP
jgi:hypothetical protein